MKFKDVLKFEKENMSEFQWKFEKYLFAFLAIFLGGAILTLIISIIIGFVSGENGFWYIPIVVWVSILAVALIVLVIISKKVKIKLQSYHKEKLANEFYLIDYLEAKQNLLDKQKITEDGFIVEPDNPFVNTVIPFERVKIFFNPHFWGGKLFLEIIVKDECDWLFVDHLDNSTYNFLTKHTSLIQNKNLFHLFCEDKDKFIKMLLRYNDAAKIEKKLNFI